MNIMSNLIIEFTEAIKQGNIIKINECLDNGIDINAMCNKYLWQTGLHLACKFKHFHTVNLLIKRGANLNIKDSSGWTPTHYAIYYDESDILSLLARNGALLNEKDYKGDSPLIWACITKNIFCTMLLIHYGADTTVKLKEGIPWDKLDTVFTKQVYECLEAERIRDKERRIELNKIRLFEFLPNAKQLNLEKLVMLQRS